MDCTFKFTNISLRQMNLTMRIITLPRPQIKLLIQTATPIHQMFPLFRQNPNPRVLCKTFLFPFGQCPVELINLRLLPRPNPLLILDIAPQYLDLAFA